MNETDFKTGLGSFLTALGEDASRPGLEKTPQRVWESMHYLTRGYREDLNGILCDATFEEPTKDLVIVKDIEFISICEHHMLPFFGYAHVGYIPAGKLIGLSKIARVVDHFACRLQVQERLGAQIADCLMETLNPVALCVTVSATHMCMAARGVRKHDSKAVSSAWRGLWADDRTARGEFLTGITLR